MRTLTLAKGNRVARTIGDRGHRWIVVTTEDTAIVNGLLLNSQRSVVSLTGRHLRGSIVVADAECIAAERVGSLRTRWIRLTCIAGAFARKAAG